MQEISSCSCFTFLPGPAWLLLNKSCTPFGQSLYMLGQREACCLGRGLRGDGHGPRRSHNSEFPSKRNDGEVEVEMKTLFRRVAWRGLAACRQPSPTSRDTSLFMFTRLTDNSSSCGAAGVVRSLLPFFPVMEKCGRRNVGEWMKGRKPFVLHVMTRRKAGEE